VFETVRILKYVNPGVVFYSIVLTIIVSLVESKISTVFLHSNMVGPVVEETAKFFVLCFAGITSSITYTLTFALIEFIEYIKMMISDNTLTISILIIRFMIIGLHLLWLFIQIEGVRLYYKNNKKVRYIILGLVSAILAHFMWNIGGTI